MAKKKKNEDLELVVAEFKVSMHCNACERTVAKAISKLKGVEKFSTNMKKHEVVVTGRIDPQKVMKKLKKKTGKRVEIVVNNSKKKGSPKPGIDEGNNGKRPVGEIWLFDFCKESEVLMMFSDENPNACLIM
ncbi:heavy metal-associated isoprenylated plant protein 19-like [Pistacia vera]|uniref:heavy metal-associated isoprenylated plant protein 19-like n=1 Tax=Pistacia vera TaxID=55513 RepID=UPI0012636A30|nr:heavy metal-associated isoprenylated plant protein 19-like [Pistacia vera]